MNKDFFSRDPEIVAQDILGKMIIRKFKGKEYCAKIVETEAYFGSEDPASRARQNGDLRATMEMDAGTILVYGVHNNWLINFVTGPESEASAVLIRACEPMNFNDKCNGPGLLTRALKIDKRFHKRNILDDEEIGIINFGERNFQIVESFRIGVVKDLPCKLRFYIKDNKWVSRK